ncbi:DUF3783 domain-containing protein [Clostridium akagii]|uniref:DUF3783 domain-containing protein n=1 Tax=Clostridium akagii TaxID=91623 RepID=UPI00047C7FBC|nr:DUF3783 domain-containing protein [Clostridium akagii]
MGLNNDKLILIYGFNQEEIVKIGEIILNNDFEKFKVIDNSMATMKIGDIIQGLEIPTLGKTIPDQKVILFNNLEDEQLQKTLVTLKEKIGNDTIFAVVTQTSIEWTFDGLLEHLMEEKKWASKRKK